MREERIKSILNVISKQNDISLPYLDTLKIVDIKEEQTGDAILICTVNRGDVSEDVLKKYKNTKRPNKRFTKLRMSFSKSSLLMPSFSNIDLLLLLLLNSKTKSW